MIRTLSILAAATLFAGVAQAQVTYSFNFDTNSTGWTGNFARFTDTTVCGGTGGAMRRNLWSSATTGQLISPSTGTSFGGLTTITYDYKVANWSPNTVPTPTPWGSFDVQYGSTATGPWTTFATVTNETQTGSCLSKTHTFSPPAGPLFIRWSASYAVGSGADYWLNFDNVMVTETVAGCSGTPAPGDVTGASGGACPGANFTLGLQNATTGSGVTYQWYSSTVSSSGPWTALGTAATQTASQVQTTWYYCDVTCSAGPATGSSNVRQVDMAVPTFPQDFGTGTATPNCWSTAIISGTWAPDYNAASAFGVGAGSVRFNFYNASNTSQMTLTSPEFAAVGAGTPIYFDVAGATYTGGEIDSIELEESNDGGATWTPVVTMTNQPGVGVLNTGGAVLPNFVPTATQWASLNYTLNAGTNRIRFRGVSNFGNSCFLDNISVGVMPSARHTNYGVSCVSPAYTMSAAPAPITGTTFTYTQTGIPEAVAGSGVYFGVVVLSVGQNFPGTPLNVLSAGAIDSPCNLHVASPDVLVSFISGTSSDSSVTFDVPLAAPIGFLLYAQAAALIAPAAPNNAGIVTSSAVRTFINSF
jgi:hypothetical protein